MPRSSRHKSKRSVKEGREYSVIEEDVSTKGKRRDGKESGEKRKLVVVNGYSSDEYVGSKKRKERAEKVESDRWNGSGVEGALQFDDKFVKLKSLKDENVELLISKEESLNGKVDSKRKLEREVSEKEKLDRDLNGKDDCKVKDSREKEKGTEREYRSVDSKRDLDYRAVDREEPKAKSRYGSKDWFLEDDCSKHEPEKECERRKKKPGEFDDMDKNQDCEKDANVAYRRDRVKDRVHRDERHKDITHRDTHSWDMEEVYVKYDPEKERETRRRKRTAESNDKDKYQEGNKDSSDTNVASKRERHKDGRDRDARHKASNSRDKNHEYYDWDSKSKDIDKREGIDRVRTLKYDEYSDDHASRDYGGSKFDPKYVRDEFDSRKSQEKKSRNDSSNFDSRVKYDDQDQRSRYKDFKETRGSMDKHEYVDVKSRGTKEYPDPVNIKSAGAKEETVSERETSLAFHPDEFTASQSRQKSSLSSTPPASRDQYRHSKQSETDYREPLSLERNHSNLNYGKEGHSLGAYDRSHTSRAVDKSVQRGESGHVDDLSSERRRSSDRHVSPTRLADKSQSPISTECRHRSRNVDRRSFYYEDSGHRSSGSKDPNFHHNDGKRSQDRTVEAPSFDASYQADGDKKHSSSLFSRSAKIPGNSRSFLRPASPSKHGVDNSYAGATEDGRGKLNNQPKRSIDSSMGRVQGNAWWGAPNWSSPMGNGYLPFPHGPAAVGFHPMMQQLPPQMFGSRPPMDHSGVPFHMPDGDRFPCYGHPFGWPNPVDETCPSPIPNLDSNNIVPGESQGLDQNRSLTGSASRESSVVRYKNVTAEPNDDLSFQSDPSLKHEPFQSEHQVDEAGDANLFGNKHSTYSCAPLIEASGRIYNANISEKGMGNVDFDDYISRSCAYLSKIEISAHLAHSDLFNQCMSLLAVKQSTLSDVRMSGFSLKEENDKEVECTMINTYFSHAPVFAEVNDSLIEIAMAVYRQHRDNTAVNYSSSALIGDHDHQSPGIQGSEIFQPATSQLVEANDQELELVYPGPLNDLRDTTPINHSKMEAPSPMTCDVLDVDVTNNPEVPISTISSSEKVKEELISVLDRRVAEITSGDAADTSNTDVDEGTRGQIPNIITSCNDVDADGDGAKEINDKQAALESATILPSSTNVHFEGCEDTRITELNECRPVKLSRIH